MNEIILAEAVKWHDIGGAPKRSPMGFVPAHMYFLKIYAIKLLCADLSLLFYERYILSVLERNSRH